VLPTPHFDLTWDDLDLRVIDVDTVFAYEISGLEIEDSTFSERSSDARPSASKIIVKLTIESLP
jgi:hypothetical protein